MEYSGLLSGRIRIILVFLAIVLVIAILYIIAPSSSPKVRKPTPSAGSGAVGFGGSNNPSEQLPPPTLSCGQYETVYGPNYYAQVAANQAAWGSSGTIDTQTILNYEYNITAQQSYTLYVDSMADKGCSPSISAPAALTPAFQPDDSLISGSGFQSSCNAPLAVQNVGLYNGQFSRDQAEEQLELQKWLAAELGHYQQLTTSFWQGMVAIESEFNQDAQHLINDLDMANEAVNCH